LNTFAFSPKLSKAFAKLCKFFLLVAMLSLASCAVDRSTRQTKVIDGQQSWSGKINITLETTPTQSFTADFDLFGNAQSGEIQLYSSMGTTLALAKWDENGGELTLNNKTSQHFDSLQEMTTKLTGVGFPLQSVFSWLKGNELTPPLGWELIVDSKHLGAEGKKAPKLQTTSTEHLNMQRLSPTPRAQLHLWIEPVSP
jgi:outer membrane lipoprotein LolB